jgi:hypothetical protein
MENNLDKYFKEKLEGRQFEMKDAYWQNAQKLLAEDERRRRRAIWFWWGGGAMVLFTVLVFILSLNGNKENIVAENTNSNTGNSIEIKEEKIKEELEKKLLNDKKSSEEKEIKSDDEIQPNEESVARRNNLIEDGFGEVISNNTASKEEVKGEYGVVEENDEIIVVEESKVESKEELKAEAATTEAENIAYENLAEIDVPKPVESLLILVDDFTDSEVDLSDNIKKEKKERWSFGVSAAQLFQAPVESGEKAGIAFRAGFFTRYKWAEKNNLYLLTGLNYQRRTGTFGSSKTAESRNYRFGLELAKNELRPSSLHTLSVPILLGYEKGRHVLEAGFSLDYLTGVWGERGSVERIPDSDPPRRDFVPVESGWISEFGFKKMTGTAQFNYRFRVNTQWSFGVTTNYTLGGILEELDGNIIEGGKVNLAEDDKFYFGLQAAYIIK